MFVIFRVRKTNRARGAKSVKFSFLLPSIKNYDLTGCKINGKRNLMKELAVVECDVDGLCCAKCMKMRGLQKGLNCGLHSTTDCCDLPFLDYLRMWIFTLRTFDFDIKIAHIDGDYNAAWSSCTGLRLISVPKNPLDAIRYINPRF